MGRGKRNHPYQTFLIMANTPAFFAKVRFTRNNSTKENAPDQNIVLDFTCDEAAKAAIEKETDFERLLSHESNLEVRYTQGKITQEEYNHLSSLLKDKKTELTA